MRILVMMSAFLLSSCLQGGGSASGGGPTTSATVSGLDLSGTYDLARLECYNFTNTGSIVVSTTLQAPTERLVINGNNALFTFNTGSCIAYENANVVFTNGVYTYARTNRTASLQSGLNCSATYTSNDQSLSPFTYNENWSASTLTNLNSSYMLYGSELWLRDHRFMYNSSGWCYRVYQK
jgi:hypothetical protein